jgi:predicted nucleotidyltransferase
LGRAEELARKAAGRIVVLGSLVEGGFDTTSDLDVAVFGIPPGEDEEVAMQIDKPRGGAEFCSSRRYPLTKPPLPIGQAAG